MVDRLEGAGPVERHGDEYDRRGAYAAITEHGRDHFLAEEIGLQVEIFNPFKAVQSDSKKIDQDYLNYIGPEMAISIGLSIRPSEL